MEASVSVLDESRGEEDKNDVQVHVDELWQNER